MILHVTSLEVCGPHRLRLEFNDGARKQVDLRPLLEGPVFEPLLDPAYFARAALDATFGVVCWPNGADFAPEALQQLADIDHERDHVPSIALRPGAARR